MPSRINFSGARPVTSLPLSSTRPAAGRISPAIALSSVDFPAPLGPTTAVTRPDPASMPTFWMMGGPPYPAVRPCVTRTGPRGARPGPVSSGGELDTGGHLPEVRIDDGGVGPERGQGAVGDRPPQGHDDDRPADLLHEREVVLDHQHRHPRGDQRLDALADPPPQHRVDAGERLVHEAHARPGLEDPGDPQAPLLPAAQVPCRDVLQGQQAELAQDRPRLDAVGAL